MYAFSDSSVWSTVGSGMSFPFLKFSPASQAGTVDEQLSMQGGLAMRVCLLFRGLFVRYRHMVSEKERVYETRTNYMRKLYSTP